ncbi:MAG: AAA family ATPase [Bifidobacteriaceae bacterium]|jgi:predicted AAA+ superfamily ATPase|nr:AAA family ATPase [Bifidobacteriaceae bacterium]
MVKEVKRNMLQEAIDVLSVSPSATLLGARQVGKSTFANQLLGVLDGKIVNLEDDYIMAYAIRDTGGFLKQNDNGLLVIDEVQRLPKLTLAIKREIDKNKRPGKFLLTGSSNIMRMRKNPESLAGRTINLKMYGFSQGELLGIKEDFVSDIDNGKDIRNFKSLLTKKDYAKKMFAGQYPEQYDNFAETQKYRWFESYISNILNRDLSFISGQLVPERVYEILKIVSANQAGELVKGRIGGSLEIPRNSVSNYIDTLETLGLIATIPVYSRNLTKKAIQYKKSIVLDSALCMYLNTLNTNKILDPKNLTIFGHLFEGFIISEILKQKEWSKKRYNLYHYRNARGEEIDLIIELDDGSLILMEIKGTSTHRYDDFKNIFKLKNELGDKVIAGFVVNTSDSVQAAGDNCWFIPASLLWEVGNFD